MEIDNKINLGFSGGGFRATFYCLGAYRRLVELGLEKHVSEITSVSGGSIAAGAVISALAEGDFSSLLDFDRRVTTKLINLGQCNFRRRIMTKASWLAYLLPYLPKLQQDPFPTKSQQTASRSLHQEPALSKQRSPNR